MKKTIKIIDLLVRCVKGDETLPTKIKHHNKIYDIGSSKEGHCYYHTESGKTLLDNINYFIDLTEDVEIIEEDKKIEKIGKSFKTNCLNNDLQQQIETIQYNCALSASKIDEIIDLLNEIDKGE